MRLVEFYQLHFLQFRQKSGMINYYKIKYVELIIREKQGVCR